MLPLSEALLMKFTSFSWTVHQFIVHVKQWAASSWDFQIHYNQHVAAQQPGP